MRKNEFLQELKNRLNDMQPNDVEKTLSFYAESIEDRMEEGIPEEEAVAQLGSVDRIVREIRAEQSLPSMVISRVKESRERTKNKGLWMALAVIGFPFWFPVLITMASLLFAGYITLWALIVSFAAIDVSLAAASVYWLVSAVAIGISESALVGIATAGIALCIAGGSLLLFPAVAALLKNSGRLTGKFYKNVKQKLFGKKESK